MHTPTFVIGIRPAAEERCLDYAATVPLTSPGDRLPPHEPYIPAPPLHVAPRQLGQVPAVVKDLGALHESLVSQSAGPLPRALAAHCQRLFQRRLVHDSPTGHQ